MKKGYSVVALAIAGAATGMLLPTASQAQSTNAMDSQSSSTVNVMAITGPQTQVPVHQEVTYDGHTWTTPSAQGSYFGGANPCLVGTGGGAAGGPIAFNINVGRSDEGCTRRSDAAAWHAMGFDNVAVARMCQDLKSADAFFSATGQACPGTLGKRYKLADGSDAPPAVLVANSRAIPNNPNVGPIDLSNPAIQALIRAEAAKMYRERQSSSIGQDRSAPGKTAPPATASSASAARSSAAD